MTVFSIHDKLLGVYGTPQTVQSEQVAALSVGKYIFEQSADPAAIEIIFYGSFDPEYGFVANTLPPALDGVHCLSEFQEVYMTVHPVPKEEEGETK